MKNVIIADICGLCYGSNRAIESTKQALEEVTNVVLYKEILHNKNVMQQLERKGAKVKDELDALTSDDYVIIRAHGEPYSTFKYFNDNKIKFLDCTCPNVKAINILVRKKSEDGYKIIIIGKYGFSNNIMHPEVKGIAGWCTNEPIFIEDESEIDNIDLTYDKYYLVVQTTFSKDKATKFIELINNIMIINNKDFDYKNTICNAQRRINESAVELSNKVDIMLVMGGKNSSNSKELYNNICKLKPTYFIENIDELKTLIKENKLNKNNTIGITAGASTMNQDILDLKEALVNLLK